MKKHLTVKILMLVVLLAIAAVGASAQTQTSTVDGTTAAVVPAAPADPHVTAAGARPTLPTTAMPAAQGAGSTQDSYVWARGYIFTVHRSNGNPAIINSSATGTVSSVDDFDYGTEKAFKIEAGWNSPTNHFGFRISYFRTTQSADEARTQGAAAPFFISPRPLNVLFTGAPDTGTAATFTERFRLHLVDVEGTRKWANPNHSVVGSIGLRIAPTRQVYQARDIFAGAPELVEYIQRRTGIGPTGAVDVRHHVGAGFWVTAAGRVALLFGPIRETARYDAAPFFTESATRKTPRTQTTWEGEGGLEWSSGGFFANGSFIYHDWRNLVNVMPTAAVGGSSVAVLDSPGSPPTIKGSVRFVGGAFSVGFRF